VSGAWDGPPRWARRLLTFLLPRTDPGTLIGDLDEEYVRFVRPDVGRFRADVWYVRQVVLSSVPLVLRYLRPTRPGTGFLLGDLRFAARFLLRRPGATLAIVGTLALGLGVNTTVFSVVDGVLLRALPYQHEDRLVRPVPGELFFHDLGEAQEVERRMTTLDAYAAWGRTLFLFPGDGDAEEVRGARVSWNHFDMLGAPAMLGRTFVAADAVTDDALVLGHGLWMRRYGGDPDIVGRTVPVFDGAMTVIGVMGPNHVPMEYDWQAWRPLPADPALLPSSGLAGNGRLRPGVTLEEARTEFGAVVSEIWMAGGYVASPDEIASLEVVPVREWLLGDVSRGLWVLLGAVAFLLLLACANVASLLLALSGGRAREFAVRAALGAGRGHLARQALVEVGLLFATGAAAAVVASWAVLPWLVSQLPPDLPRADAVGLSASVTMYTVLLTLAAALVTGALPVARSGGASLGALAGTGKQTSSRRRNRARSVLVAGEMAVAVVLIVGAGLMVRTMISLTSVDTGFQADGVVTVRPSPPADRYAEPADLEAYYAQLTDELTALPGVSSVGAIQFLPMTPGGWWGGYLPEGRVIPEDENRPMTAFRVIREGYFETMRVPVLSGRPLVATDAEAGSEGIVINETLMREAFPDGEAIGRTMTMGDGTVLTVVGIVADVHQSDLRTASHAEAYVAFGLRPWRRMHMVVRYSGDEAAILGGVAAAVRRLDGSVTMLGPRSMTSIVGSTLGSARLLTSMLALFGVIGMGLGAIGVYGVTAQAVGEQRREIGIRMALGAEASGVVRRTIGRGMAPVAAGLAIGLGLAIAGVQLLEGLLFGVEPVDVGTFASAPVLLVVVAFASLAVPAVRAARVDPVRTLREE